MRLEEKLGALQSEELRGKAVLIDGIHIPLTVPFTRDGALYRSKLEYNVRRYSLTPAAGLVALTGEGEALSDAEMLDVLRCVSDVAAPEKVLIARVAKESVRGALWLAEQAATTGFDAVLLRAPRSLGEQERRVFFAAVADGSELPVLLSSAVSGLPVEMVAEMAQHPNVIGVFDAGLTVERYRSLVEKTKSARHEVTVTTVFAPVTRRMRSANAEEPANFVAASSLGGAAVLAMPAVKTRTKTVGFQVMAAGAAAGLVELLATGVAGAMPTLAACAPQGCYEAFAAFKDGDPALAAEKEQRLVEADALMAELGIAGVKYGCDWNGYFGGAPRLPRLGLDAAARGKVERVLVGLRN